MKWIPLKRLCVGTPQYGLNTPASAYSDTGVHFIRTTDIGSDGSVADDGAVYVDPALVGDTYTLVDGDLLFSRSGTLGRHLLYRQAMGEATFAGYLIRFRPSSEVSSVFLAYCAQARFFQEAIGADAVSSTISNFNADKYSQLRIPSWPLREQRAIADFLDAEAARIGALITKKRRLSRVAYERLAVVTRRVTTFERRSLPIRRVVEQVKTGTTPSREAATLITDDGEVEWITPGDFDMLPKLSPSARRVAMEAVSERHVPLFPAGSVLVVGIGATAGKVAYAERPVSSNQQVTALVPGDLLDGRFLGWQLWSRKDELRETAPHTTLPILNNDFLRSLHVDLPDKVGQIRIANELDRQAELTSRLVFSLREQIDLLTERRQALITAAVTGEFDVARSIAEEAS